jgi:hypothetical protein
MLAIAPLLKASNPARTISTFSADIRYSVKPTASSACWVS